MERAIDQIAHMLTSMESIQNLARGGYGDFVSNQKAQQKVIRHFQSIGRTAGEVDQDTRSLALQIPWKAVESYGEISAHQFDIDKLWSSIEEDLPPLKRVLEYLLRRLKTRSAIARGGEDN